jgi:four helix bundle protein
MLAHFRTYQLAVQLHAACRALRLPAYLRSQLLRAASSVALNLAEGSAKPTAKDQARFYSIALGSLRECQAVLQLADLESAAVAKAADRLGAHLFCLIRSRSEHTC